MTDSLVRPPLPWHEAAAAKRLQLGLPQALMVIGRRGDGLEQLCLHLATQTIASDGGSNPQLLEAGNHPDLHVVQLEQGTTGKPRASIVIGQIRSALEQSSLTPMCAKNRICVIVPACRMNAHASNSLLKALEEPHRGLKFILGCENHSLLPATIRSRCQRMPAPQPTLRQAKHWLAGQDIADPDAALAMASNAPLAAQANVGLADVRKQLARHCIGNRPLAGSSPLDKLEARVWLPWTIAWAAEGARQANGLPSSELDVGAIASAINKRHQAAPLSWLDLYDELNACLRLTAHPINNRILLERVCWRFNTLAPNAD